MKASDWVDGCNLKSIAAGLYMFFGCLAPGIAFGAAVQVAAAASCILHRLLPASYPSYCPASLLPTHRDDVAHLVMTWQVATGGRIGVIEYLLTQGITGVVFACLSGQPLIILRPTGPITLFTTSLYLMAQAIGVDFLQLHAWVGRPQTLHALPLHSALSAHCHPSTARAASEGAGHYSLTSPSPSHGATWQVGWDLGGHYHAAGRAERLVLPRQVLRPLHAGGLLSSSPQLTCERPLRLQHCLAIPYLAAHLTLPLRVA